MNAVSNPFNVIVFAKEKPGLTEALDFLELYTPHITLFKGELGHPFPVAAFELEPDIIISYLSPWIIPPVILEKTRVSAINFHPGSPEYPGIGCTNFALYNRETSYGVTCHIMEKTVDSGQIISVKRFPILENDNVYSLTQRCYRYILIQFYEVIHFLFTTGKLPDCPETWKRKPYTRQELNALCQLQPDASETEIKRLIRATYFPGKTDPYILVYGYTFSYTPK